jgi:hypothetical protein
MSEYSSNLLTLFGSSSTDAASSILDVLNNGATATASGVVSTGNPITDLQLATANESKDVAQTEQQPAIARDIATFETAVQTATSPAQLLQNPTVLKVLLTASGMSDQADFTALAQRALLSNSTDSTSLVNQLSDSRWLTVNETYDFANKGLSVIQNPQVLSDVASGYAEQIWLQSLDSVTPGLSNAISFRTQASTITSALQILGNPVMWSVVTTALGIPPQIAYQNTDAQAQQITSKLDLTRFQDPKFVDSFTDQYLLTMQQQNSTSITTSIDSLAAQASGLVV